jgi:hypothetical protein
MFPALDEFSQTPFNAININSNNQENRFSSSQSRSDSIVLRIFFESIRKSFSSGKNTTSLSSNEDDREVANSFPNNDSMNKTTAFPILQVPRSFQLNVRNDFLLFCSLISFNIIFSSIESKIFRKRK